MIFKLCLTAAFVVGLNFVVCQENDVQLDRKNNDNNVKSSLVALSQVEDADINSDEDFAKNKKLFHATEDWQIVKSDEMIPPGLEVRLNLQTGLKEARLLSKETESDKNDREERIRSKMQAAIEETLAAMKEGTLSNEEKSSEATEDLRHSSLSLGDKISRTKLKHILKKLKDDHIVEQPHEKDFRSMEEIKKEFKNLNIDVKLDSEILRELLTQYNRTDLSDAEKLDILESLEYYLHQIDNANLFVDAGGLALLARDLNGTSDDVKTSSFLALAAAVQSNPHAQVAAVREGLLELTVVVVTTSASSSVRARGVGALSSFLRNFPYAQKKFGDIGGFEFAVGLARDGKADGKVAAKVISMISDLLEEQISTGRDEYIDADLKNKKMKQYEMVKLTERIGRTDWCQLLPRFLSSGDLATEEKILNSMSLWLEACRGSHDISGWSEALLRLQIRLDDPSLHEDGREFAEELSSVVREISRKLKVKTEL